MRRQSVGRTLSIVALASVAVAFGAGRIEARGQAEVEVVVSEFVGTIERDGEHAHDILIAVVADPATGETAERRVRVYLCDAHDTWGWFDGAAGPDRFSLTTEDGAEVQGRLTDEGVDGTLVLADGTRLNFDAIPATGPAGLYHLFVGEEGAFGVSTSGIALHVQCNGAEATATFLYPDGQIEETTLPVIAWGTGNFRVVVGATEPVHHTRGSSYKPGATRSAQSGAETQVLGLCFE
jgi:hypothetical protein